MQQKLATRCGYLWIKLKIDYLCIIDLCCILFQESIKDTIIYDVVDEYKPSCLKKIKQTISKIYLSGGTQDVHDGKLFEVLNAFHEKIEEL
jgi:hypothetical protein